MILEKMKFITPFFRHKSWQQKQSFSMYDLAEKILDNFQRFSFGFFKKI